MQVNLTLEISPDCLTNPLEPSSVKFLTPLLSLAYPPYHLDPNEELNPMNPTKCGSNKF